MSQYSASPWGTAGVSNTYSAQGGLKGGESSPPPPGQPVKEVSDLLFGEYLACHTSNMDEAIRSYGILNSSMQSGPYGEHLEHPVSPSPASMLTEQKLQNDIDLGNGGIPDLFMQFLKMCHRLFELYLRCINDSGSNHESY